MEVYRVSPGYAIADLLDALRQRGFERDLVVDTIQLLQQRIRLLEQQRNDAERVIEERDQTIDRQAREHENLRQHAIKLDDCPRPEVVAQILKHILRSWPRARWQALIDHIRRFLSERHP